MLKPLGTRAPGNLFGKEDSQMYCTKCGADIGNDPICLRCGQPAEGSAPVYQTPEAQPPSGEPEGFSHRDAVRLTLAGAMSSPLLIAVGLLLIVEAVLGIVLAGREVRTVASFSMILAVLKGAGLLIAAFTAKKKQEHYLGEGSGLFRVMMMIDYVLGWVIFGFVCLGLVLMLAFRSVFSDLFSQFIQNGVTTIPGFTFTAAQTADQMALQIIFWTIIAALAVAAIVLFFWILFYYRGRVVMGRDIMTSLQEGHFFVRKVRAVRGWSLFIAIVNLLGGGSTVLAGSLVFDRGISPATGVAQLAAAALHFLVFLWVGFYFIPKGNEQ